MTTQTFCCSRTVTHYPKAWWLARITQGRHNPKPPSSWFSMKEGKGIPARGAAMIWHRRYKPEKKAMHWALADFSEWCAAGMHIAEDE